MHQSEFIGEESRGCGGAYWIDSPLSRGVCGCEKDEENEDVVRGDAALHCGSKR